MNNSLPWLNNLWRRVAGPSDPAGYRPGATLARLMQELPAWETEHLSARRLRLTLPQGVSVQIDERTQSLFMAHIAGCHFRVEGECRLHQPFTLSARTKGWFSRDGVTFFCREEHAGSRQVLAALERYPQIAGVLSGLTFRRWHMQAGEGKWRLDIEPFAASEVVSRLPPGRRYLRLGQREAHNLFSVLLMFSQLMERLDDEK